ncbi:MAG TPA: nitronate monooxygenase, partial [Ilumatobacteraceae bacterium]|nr:nitronate monooxygenase [Ilumatobacteraceae bacterium]
MTANRFTELIGCRLPVQQAGMSGTATPALAAAVANAGGLGMIGIGRQQFDVIERYLDEVDALTTNPVGCSCIGHFVRPEVVELAASRLPIVEFFYE